MKLLFVLLFTIFFPENGFYDITIYNVSGNSISLSQFKGKKVLIINTASGSKYYRQLGSLQKLHSKYSAGLAIIAFPSNSFNNEPLSNSALADSMRAKGYTFIVASKSDVTGPGMNPVFQYLSDKQKNGRTSINVSDDFKKILLDKNGMVQGVFASQLDPMDSLLQKIISSPSN
jgi:glutathione peroxidase